ncbi:hypothetical protein QO002_003757 [Pararhizobium capsulatum DSM 1112]|uniref:Uncharacterized protein n=2 Tax=Pararhizobium capsulatum TaxID=34014 RepID=A0ABU0BTN3_9HYPH|nr:hypothetical protein [Pararhizobium capsulatum DSM 1112]
MTAVVIQPLEGELRREYQKTSLPDRIALTANDLARLAGPHGRPLDKEEIDSLWFGSEA